MPENLHDNYHSDEDAIVTNKIETESVKRKQLESKHVINQAIVV